MENHQLINQTSGEVEYYTPPEIIEAARRTMGRIDLDPASSEKANDRVKAANIFTKENNGLSKRWFGNVFLNHPFHGGWKACTSECKRKTCSNRGFHVYHDIPSNADWINYLEGQFRDANLDQSCNITYAATSEKWFQPLMKYPQCFFKSRVNYLLPDGSIMKGVTKGSVVTYMGYNVADFAREFERFGTIKIKYSPRSSA